MPFRSRQSTLPNPPQSQEGNPCIPGRFDPKLPAPLPRPRRHTACPGGLSPLLPTRPRRATLAWGCPGALIPAGRRASQAARHPSRYRKLYLWQGGSTRAPVFPARFKTHPAELVTSVNDGDTYGDAWLSGGTRLSHLARAALQRRKQTLG